MGERRRRKSLWDQEDDTRNISAGSEPNSRTGKDHHSHHGSSHYHEVSASGTFAEVKSRDYAGQPSAKSTEEILVAPMHGNFNTGQGAPEGKQLGGGNTNYQNMSSGFEGVEQHKYIQDLGNGQSYSRRYMGRGRSRSRSRSRSRTRGRSRSRSLSRGRRRGRSRSRSNDSARGKNRSRSPIGDYRRQSSGWSDKRGAPENSSQVCRDFAAGNCRRGSQCRFLHPKSVTCGNSVPLGDNTGNTWRDVTNSDQISKPSFNKGGQSDLPGDTSYPYSGQRQNEQFRSRSTNAVACRDFVKGKCRWGDSCRFSHHSGHDGTFEKSTNCKYFAAGKCDRDNCRFSHEDPKYGIPEGRQREVAKDYGPHDKINPWNDATIISDNPKPVGHSYGNENKIPGVPEWTGDATEVVRLPPPPGEVGGYGQDFRTAEFIGKGSAANKQEHLILHGSQFQNLESNTKVQGQNVVQDNFSTKVQQQPPNVSSALPIQPQHHGVAANNLLASLASNVLVEVENGRNTTQTCLISGLHLNQNGETLFPGQAPILNETVNGQNQICHMNLESKVQNHMQTVQMTGILDSKITPFVPALFTNENLSQLTNSTVARIDQHVTPVTVPPVAPDQRNPNGQPQTDAEGSNSWGVAPFSDSSGNIPLVSVANLNFNQVKVSHDQTGLRESGQAIKVHANYTGQANEIKVEQPSPSSNVGKEQGNAGVGHSGCPPELKQETLLTNPDVDESNATVGNESRVVENNMESEPLDKHGKVEENSMTKDDKAVRTFKNSLIEFVKDLLKPAWKEGKMSRDIHKTIVKKVVEKVSGTIQADHIPKTQEKVDQYLSYSKPKIAKLVQAYVTRSIKADAKS